MKNNMYKTTFVLAGLVLFFQMAFSPAYARLGETREQCIKRYGGVWSEKKVGVNGIELNMPAEQLADPRINVILYNNVCHKISFTSSKQNYFTLKIVEDLLEKNAEGNRWSKPEKGAKKATTNDWVQSVEESSDSYHWERSDGGHATLGWSGTVEIESGSYRKLSMQDEKKKMKALDDLEKEKLNSF